MMTKGLLLCLLLFIAIDVFAYNDKDFGKQFKLLPQPQHVIIHKKNGIDPRSIQGILLKGPFPRPVLYGLLKNLPLVTKETKGTVIMNLSNDPNLPGSLEGYKLDIDTKHIVINARTEAGLFYGAVTLSQLMDDAQEQHIQIPSCTIIDYPDVAYRAVHLDVKHHLDAGHYYYSVIDRLAQIKVNAIVVEFEDKLRYRKAPAVGASNAISIEEFAAISRYAKERNIEISPLVQGLGHASYILKHDEYKSLRDDSASDWSFDAVNPGTYDLQFALYEDALSATPYGKYLHVGGDEVGNLGMSELAKKSGLTHMQLQMQWLTKVCEFARQHHRIPIFWDDMVFKLSGLYQTTWDANIQPAEVEKIWKENGHRLEENIQLFPRNCVYMRWNYDTPEIPGNEKAIDWYKSHQLTVMAATAAQTMWPLLPRENSNYLPIKNFCRITTQKKLSGILCTAWDDCSPHFETYWRGFHDFAFFSWHYKETSAEQVHSVFRHRFYGSELSDSAFDIQSQLEQAISFWETALLQKGDRNNYHKHADLISLPDENETGSWSKQYKNKLQQAAVEVKRYASLQMKLNKAMHLARRNRYSLELLNEINELQIYPAKLLLMLDEYDNASTSGKATAKLALQQYVESFNNIRRNFESVFSQTRFLSNPADYILDQNHHEHLANGTVNSDWMYIYELPMNLKIKEWLRMKGF